jgi:hypothetical protein
MSRDPMKLVKFVCVAKAHADGRSPSALTIHDGAWAFCPKGAESTGHEWRPSDGLPLTDAMRFTPRQQAADQMPAAPTAPAAPVNPATPATARGKARPR